MNRTKAREIAREIFPCFYLGRPRKSYEDLVRNDPIAAKDLLDHIQYNEPLQEGTIEY